MSFTRSTASTSCCRCRKAIYKQLRSIATWGTYAADGPILAGHLYLCFRQHIMTVDSEYVPSPQLPRPDLISSRFRASIATILSQQTSIGVGPADTSVTEITEGLEDSGSRLGREFIVGHEEGQCKAQQVRLTPHAGPAYKQPDVCQEVKGLTFAQSATDHRPEIWASCEYPQQAHIMTSTTVDSMQRKWPQKEFLRRMLGGDQIRIKIRPF